MAIAVEQFCHLVRRMGLLSVKVIVFRHLASVGRGGEMIQSLFQKFALSVSTLGLIFVAAQSFGATPERPSESDGDVSNGLNSEEIGNTIFLESIEVSTCYRDVLKKVPGLKGSLRLSWDIDEKGKALNFKRVSGTVFNEDIVECIAGVLEKAEFPGAQPGQQLRVEYPFKFTL